MGFFLRDEKFLFGELDLKKTRFEKDIIFLEFSWPLRAVGYLYYFLAVIIGWVLFKKSTEIHALVFLGISILFILLLLFGFGFVRIKSNIIIYLSEHRIKRFRRFFSSKTDEIIFSGNDQFEIQLDKGCLTLEICKSANSTVPIFAQTSESIYKLHNSHFHEFANFIISLRAAVESHGCKIGTNFWEFSNNLQKHLENR